MAIDQPERASVGRPITRLGVSLVPVYLHGALPLPVLARDAQLTIEELEAAAVPAIAVTNPLDQPVLLVQGDTVVGGQQNRTLNVSVLVPAGRTIEVPVSCVEAGRWDDGRQFRPSHTFATRRVRRATQTSVGQSRAAGRGAASDQGAVWATIDHELARFDTTSATRALHAVADRAEADDRLAAATAELVRMGPLPGQCGVVVTYGRRTVAAEVLGSPELLQANWEPLVRAALLDAPAAQGRPSATTALRMLRIIAQADAVEAPGVGLGRELHLCAKYLVGQALLVDDTVVHASGFAFAA